MRSKMFLISTLTILISGCADAPTDHAKPLDTFCGRLGSLATDHAGALAEDGGPKSKQTGVKLISAVDGGCEAAK